MIEALRLGGLTPLTTIDFPGRLAAVVFCQGCPWRCRYCQNTHLIPRQGGASVSWHGVTDFLRRRRGLLDGVVFSGGEPTAQSDLAAALGSVRDLGYETGLHSAGPYPQRLARVLPLLDWIGLDIKAPRDGYADLTGGGRTSGERAWRSLEQVLASGVDYEVRTTVHPSLMAEDTLYRLASELAAMGVRRFVVQGCISGQCLDPALRDTPQAHLSPALQGVLRGLFESFAVRGA